jgi:tetratricopeptide (TPR) repeat protein
VKSKGVAVVLALLVAAKSAAQITIHFGREEPPPVTIALLAFEVLAREAERELRARHFAAAYKGYRKAAKVAEESRSAKAPRYWFFAGFARDRQANDGRASDRSTLLRDAQAAYTTSLVKEPKAPWTMNNLALVEFELGMKSEATTRLNALVGASKNDRDYTVFATNLGDMLAKQEQWEEALKAYHDALIADSSNAPAAAAFAAIARTRDVSRLPPLVAELLALHRTSAAAQIAGDAIRDEAFVNIRPALDTSLLIAAAQHIDQRHREHAVALLATNADDTLNAARALLETRQPSGDLTSPALRRLATALGDEAAGQGRSEDAERLYVYGASHLDTAAPSRLVDLYLSNGDRAKLVKLATSVETIPVGSSQVENVAAYEYHRAAMAAFGVLGNDPSVPAANATFHAEKAKQYGHIANIESVRDIDRLQMKFQKPPPAAPPPIRPPAVAPSEPCVAIDSIIDASGGQLRVTIGEGAVFRPPVGGRRLGMEVETSIALCGNILLAANPRSGVHVYDVEKRVPMDGRTQLLLVQHRGPMAVAADRIAIAEGPLIYIASIDSGTKALGASMQYDIGEPIRSLSFTHSGLRVTTTFNKERTIDVVP